MGIDDIVYCSNCIVNNLKNGIDGERVGSSSVEEGTTPVNQFLFCFRGKNPTPVLDSPERLSEGRTLALSCESPEQPPVSLRAWCKKKSISVCLPGR